VGVKKDKKRGFVNSKKYGAKVKLYYLEDGDITYYVTFKVAGKKFIKPIGKKSNGWSEKRAFEQRAKLIDKVKLGEGVYDSVIRVGELATQYFEWAEIHNRSWEKTLKVYEKHFAEFDNKIVNSLDDKDLIKLQKKLKDKKLADSYINDVVGILTRVINFGVKRGIIEKSPFKMIQKLKVDNSRDRFLTKSEIERLLEAVKDDRDLYLFIMLAINTGARVNSVLNIKKRDVDFENKKITIKDIKRGKTYTIPLNSRLYEVLREVETESYIVGSGLKWSYSKLYKELNPVLNKLFNEGLDKEERKKKIVIHSLRHTFASHLALNNAPLDKIKNMMHHADINMTLKYAHLLPDSGSEFVEKIYG